MFGLQSDHIRSEILQIVLLDVETFAVAVVPFGAVLPAVTSAETSDNDLFLATVGVPIFTCVMFAVAVVAVVAPDTVVLVRFVIAPMQSRSLNQLTAANNENLMPLRSGHRSQK